MASNETGALYCGENINNLHTNYKNVHGYISLIVCILGTIANTLNIIVLSRREMRSPTNAILTGLAVADLAVMLEYIPYTIHDYILWDHLDLEHKLSYSWACFIKFHSIFGQVLHTISIWLTVTLAVWRYIAVAYPQKNRQWCGMRTTMITITSAYVVCLLVVSPSMYLVTSIAKYRDTIHANGRVSFEPLTQYVIDYYMDHGSIGSRLDGVTAAAANGTGYQSQWQNANSSTITTSLDFTTTAVTSPGTEVVRTVITYRLYHSELALHNKTLQYTTFLIYSVVIKLIPCIALTILSIRLIMALLEAKRRRKMLTTNAANGMKPMVNDKTVKGEKQSSAEAPHQKPRKNSKTLEKEKQTDRTTRMLLAVLLLFLITEFPQGILGLLNTILGDDFYMQCYLKLSDLMDILALINSSINFILYCSMSRQFRTTFTLLFRPKFLDRWLPVAQDEETIAGVQYFGRHGSRARGSTKNGVKRDAVSKSCMQKAKDLLNAPRTTIIPERKIAGSIFSEKNHEAEIDIDIGQLPNKTNCKNTLLVVVDGTMCQTLNQEQQCKEENEKYNTRDSDLTQHCNDDDSLRSSAKQTKNSPNKWLRRSSSSSSLLNCIICKLKHHPSLKHPQGQQHQQHFPHHRPVTMTMMMNTNGAMVDPGSPLQKSDAIVVVMQKDSSSDHQVYVTHVASACKDDDFQEEGPQNKCSV
ncbi:G-protein coupled receptor dmsr-1-like [Haematobia irritans]|uniref:G-protein coupled receptor dmsr-1-like n=1 Tax=Haematobia irritans TaxID=7368 RepID=UPI003F4F860F